MRYSIRCVVGSPSLQQCRVGGEKDTVLYPGRVQLVGSCSIAPNTDAESNRQDVAFSASSVRAYADFGTDETFSLDTSTYGQSFLCDTCMQDTIVGSLLSSLSGENVASQEGANHEVA